MTKEPIKICILGGGFGGLYTALYLSRFAWVKSGKCQITLVEPKERFLFSPLLYEILTDELQSWEIAPSYEKLLFSTKINFCQDKVIKLNLQTRQVYLEKHQPLTYDYLVLAVGGKTKFIEIPGVATHALSFRSLADAELLKEKLRIMEASERQHLRIALVGGGPNGVELACKLADRLGKRGKITLIERGDEILKGFSAGVKAASLRAIDRRHIQISLETGISEIKADRISLVRQGQIITLPVDLVLWTAGIEPLDWVMNLDCEQNTQGKLLTRPSLQLIDRPEVFALGDLAEIRNSPTQIVPATAQSAYQQASCAAKNIQAIVTGKPLRRFYYWHLGDMLTLGKGAAVVSCYFLNIEGILAATIRRLVYIQRLPTYRHRLQVFKHLLSNCC